MRASYTPIHNSERADTLIWVINFIFIACMISTDDAIHLSAARITSPQQQASERKQKMPSCSYGWMLGFPFETATDPSEWNWNWNNFTYHCCHLCLCWPSSPNVESHLQEEVNTLNTKFLYLALLPRDGALHRLISIDFQASSPTHVCCWFNNLVCLLWQRIVFAG